MWTTSCCIMVGAFMFRDKKPNNQLLCMLLDLCLTISAQNTVRREWAGQLFYIIVQHWVLQQDRSFMLWALESWWLQPIHRSRADLGNESYRQRQTAEFLQGLECFMRCWVVQCSSEGFSCWGLFPLQNQRLLGYIQVDQKTVLDMEQLLRDNPAPWAGKLDSWNMLVEELDN